MTEPVLASGGIAAALALAAVLGFRHGFDSDHVAAIDALARVQREAGRRRLARWCGAFFSGGHALVVLVAALLAVRVGEGAAPAWADAAGGWFSIACLAVFGALNLHSAFARHRHGHLLGRALGLIRPVAAAPAGPLLIGALFALSLDTLTMAVWFGGAGTQGGGVPVVCLIALAFGAGMVVADGVSGWWINRLMSASSLQRDDAMRLVSALIGAGALGTAALGLARMLSPALDDWVGAHALALGLTLIALTSIALLALARRAASAPRPQA
ncbi:MAG TPA: nickel transporter [Quisquiliibacterium sp.]|nr:MAG: nickel transporter [Burkholderiaceae bacterium]HOA94238.1 nickel transporter [Quisquiliibacterium sp.]HPA89119.1 nickel transporter [Quisquiliibacterium sp.]HQN12582.1 nickel transporter [Quisquiliibacterium sp.]HQP67511.1 nickel transporter [Quisquiliibacterium sp.]